MPARNILRSRGGALHSLRSCPMIYKRSARPRPRKACCLFPSKGLIFASKRMSFCQYMALRILVTSQTPRGWSSGGLLVLGVSWWFPGGLLAFSWRRNGPLVLVVVVVSWWSLWPSWSSWPSGSSLSSWCCTTVWRSCAGTMKMESLQRHKHPSVDGIVLLLQRE